MRLLLFALLALVPSVAAQPAEATRDPEAAVRAVVVRLFDGMRAGDSSAVRSVFHPDARLLTAVRREERPVVMTDSVAAFVRAVGTPHDAVWDERVESVDVRVDDGLATAWMAYRFYAGEQFSHCGVNAMQLVLTETGWQIISLIDTRRRGCE